MIHKLIVPERPQRRVRRQLIQHPNHVEQALKTKAMQRAITEFAVSYRVISQGSK